MRTAFALLTLALVTVPAHAQSGNWQTPGPIQKPAGTWQTPGPIQKPAGTWQTPGPIQTPGEIQKPTGPWQTPGEIQTPRGADAVRTTAAGCERRLSVVGDALFDFDRSTLRPDAEETLAAAAPEIVKLGGKPARIEGHTDSIGSEAYNQRLSEARARTVRDWMAGRQMIPRTTPIRGLGFAVPVAPNTTPDGRDDPEGRQRNRRVEVVFETCS